MAEAQPLRAREYETIYVLRPDVTRESAEKVATRVSDVVGREGGKLTLVETWGRRALAYPVSKYKRGVYVYVKYLGGGPLVTELERNFRMLDEVLKFQTVLLRSEIDAASVEIQPDAVKFEAIEPPAEPEVEATREQELGLAEPPEGEKRRERGGEGYDDEDGYGAEEEED
ncbi:MAG TPA: 30S ribosomal protein S6 [Polyangiaceae bacterium]|nr:30S ribosomal protein S6 [Polyangiaceae bacterium]